MSQASAIPASRIKTRQLALLAHIGREGSVLAAAEAAGMSQPAASRLLRELEDTMGVPLFERHARGVVPTAYGEVVIRRAHAVLAEIGRAQQEIEALKHGSRFSVAIGSVLGPATDLLPKALALLAKRHPRLLVRVEMDTSRQLVERLLDGRLEIVIGRILDAPDAHDLAFEALADEPHGLFVRAGHPLARRRRLGLEHLVGQPWVLPPAGSALRDRLEAGFLQRGLPLPERVVETLSLPLVTSLLHESDMVVALPRNVLALHCEAGLVRQLPIDLDVRMDVFGLITRRHHPLPRQAAEALDTLRQVAIGSRTAAPSRRA